MWKLSKKYQNSGGTATKISTNKVFSWRDRNCQAHFDAEWIHTFFRRWWKATFVNYVVRQTARIDSTRYNSKTKKITNNTKREKKAEIRESHLKVLYLAMSGQKIKEFILGGCKFQNLTNNFLVQEISVVLFSSKIGAKKYSSQTELESHCS